MTILCVTDKQHIPSYFQDIGCSQVCQRSMATYGEATDRAATTATALVSPTEEMDILRARITACGLEAYALTI